MNEQRTQAYLNLINQLLSCNEGGEPRILQDNQELLDQGLVEIMVSVTQKYWEAGKESNVRRLMRMVQQLANAPAVLGNETTKKVNYPQDYVNFLIEVLQRMYQNSSPEFIYPFLEQNLDKLDETCAEILYQWATHLFPTLNPLEFWELLKIVTKFGNRIQEFPVGDHKINIEIAIKAFKATLNFCTSETYSYNWANSQYNLGNAYLKRLKGEEIDNIDMAIACYHESLRVYTPDTFFSEWSDAQNNLAEAYTIKAKKSENVEVAIACYHESLKVYNFDTFPQQWASTQLALGTIYYDRTEGEKSENLEIAITCYKNSLKVYTSDNHPFYSATLQEILGGIYFERIKKDKKEDLELAIYYYQESLKVYTLDTFPDKNWADNKWADVQNNLGRAYFDRVKGDKAENLEIAIYYYQESLKVHNLDVFPLKWADLQHNLGNAYSERIKGDRAENLEIAINYFYESLKIYPCDTSPKDWAITQNSLGLAYSERIKGDKGKNLEQAIHCFCESLKIYTFDAFPFEWALVQHNLGKAYIDRIEGEKEDNLERAIHCYSESLKVRTFDTLPLKRALTQRNLACAYFDRVRGDKAENLERAISACNEALKVYTFDAFPKNWGLIQHNLAGTYSYRVRGDKAENLEKAISFYHNALTIYTKENDPLNYLNTARNLANLHYNEKQWQPATKAYDTAIEAVENARLEALNPQSRQEILSNAIDVFHRIVQAYLNLNQPEKALEYIERSKGRNLMELMTQKNLHPQGVNQEIINKLNELKQRVVNEQIRLQHQSINQNLMRTDNLIPYAQDQNYLKQYQQELDSFIEREIKPVDPLFSLTQKVEPIPFTDIQALTDAETCLLQWYITREKILAFVVSADGDIKVWQSSEEDKNKLIEAIINYRQLYYSETGKKEWINQLSNLLQTFADILHINDILALIPDSCKRLIIIPHWFLHILPLHALPVSNSHITKFEAGANAQDLHDLFPNGVQYAPSCQLLQIAQSFHHSDFNKLFAIQNPTKDLLYTDLEVNILSNFFTESQIIAKDNATKNAIIPHLKSSNNHCHHFSCHGGFNPNNPLESALFLANKEPLTLGEIFELRLNQCRLVTLSACETGLIDINSISDEYIGLPSGFLFAGSPSVVSSLWTVNDLSTSFLMIKFYEILFDINLNISVAVALKEAQDWLQNLTIEKLDEFLEQYQPQIDKYLAPLRPGQRKIYQESLKQIRQRQPHPFANPYYWAGFTATGI